MISKELLSEVLKVNVTEIYLENIETIDIAKNYICIEYIDSVVHSRGKRFSCAEYRHINIYELAHKCKLWASMIDTDNMFVNHISSHTTKEQITKCVIGFNYIKNNILEDDERKVFTANSEQEAIFKACQWVLDNK